MPKISFDYNFAAVYPEAAAEWDYEKNGDITPDKIYPKAAYTAWWKCSKCGHKWRTAVGNRANGHGCPKCANEAKKAVAQRGYTDVASVRPDVAAEWNYEKNGNLTPDNVYFTSPKIVWWKCSFCGAEWQASVFSRVSSKGSIGCKKCAYKRNGLKIRKHATEEDNLATCYPEVAKDWNYEKNDGLRPENVRPKQNTKIWWKCHICGHEWNTRINSRTAGHGCPNCARARMGRRGSKGYVDFQGNTFATLDEMCKAHGVKVCTYYSRLGSGKTLREALTPHIVYDHKGNTFKTIREMCEFWGVNPKAYARLRYRGVSLENILEKQAV